MGGEFGVGGVYVEEGPPGTPYATDFVLGVMVVGTTTTTGQTRQGHFVVFDPYFNASAWNESFLVPGGEVSESVIPTDAPRDAP